MQRHSLVLLCLSAFCTTVPAAPISIALWDFNLSASEKAEAEALGGTAAQISARKVKSYRTKAATYEGAVETQMSLLGVSSDWNVGDAGSSDLAPDADNFGAVNTASYAGQGTGDKTRGLQFMVNTTGFQDLSFSFDQRISATASAYTALLYTLDSETWNHAQTYQITKDSSWFNSFKFDFSRVAGVADNELFGIQLVSSFAPGTQQYKTASASNYSTSGTMRYDMVSFSGNLIPEPSPVPEPAGLALLLGAGAAALAARRRRA